MKQSFAGFFPLHFWNVLQAIAITSFGLFACLALIFFSDATVEMLSIISTRSASELLESKIELIRDIALVWAIGITCVLLDALSRNSQGASLFKVLFFRRPDASAWQARAVLGATLLVTFVMTPALMVVNMGRFYLGTNWLRAEDGPLEYATAVNFVIAATLLLYKAYRLALLPREYRNVAILLVVSLMMYFVGFEEISWGQRILGFETPDTLKQINTQEEFNVHNIVTEELLRSYIYIGACLFLVSCFSCWILLTDYRSSRLQWFLVYLPDPSLLFMFALIFILSTHIYFSELIEQLASLVVLLYSARLVLCRLSTNRLI